MRMYLYVPEYIRTAYVIVDHAIDKFARLLPDFPVRLRPQNCLCKLRTPIKIQDVSNAVRFHDRHSSFSSATGDAPSKCLCA